MTKEPKFTHNAGGIFAQRLRRVQRQLFWWGLLLWAVLSGVIYGALTLLERVWR